MARPFSIALIGGLRLGGRMTMGESLTRVSAIGGLDLDLSEAEFAPSGRLRIVKVALIGDGEGPPTIKIWGFAILGGVKVRRAGVARGI